MPSNVARLPLDATAHWPNNALFRDPTSYFLGLPALAPQPSHGAGNPPSGRHYPLRCAMIRVIALWLLASLLVALTGHAEPPATMCFASDVRALCCPMACAMLQSSRWYEADAALRGCMRGLGCKPPASETVGMVCECTTRSYYEPH